MGWGGSYGIAFANQGVLTIPVYADAGTKAFLSYLIGCSIAFFGACALTMILGFKDLPSEDQEVVKTDSDELLISDDDIKILSPIKGQVIPLSEVEDEVCSSGALGKGIAIYPEIGEVRAPMDCTVSALYPTLHAIKLVLDNGIEMLIHIGIDTVELKGTHFESFVSVGDQVEKGSMIVSFDRDAIVAAGYDITTSLIITNSPQYRAIDSSNQPQVTNEDNVLFIKL